jgi:hypothetical protein
MVYNGKVTKHDGKESNTTSVYNGNVTKQAHMYAHHTLGYMISTKYPNYRNGR